MSDKSGIEWTDASWNPVTGCSRVSAGCDHCYAVRATERLAHMGAARTRAKYAGLTVLNGRSYRHFNGTVRCHEDVLDIPLRWKRPRTIFVNSMSDLFHPDVPFKFIAKVFTTMGQANLHTYQILTKRPDRLVEFFNWNYPPEVMSRADAIADWLGCWPHVWIGTSIEDQPTADQRIPHLLACPAAVRFISYEPALGPVDFSKWMHADPDCRDGNLIDWIIVGGESGPAARPMHPDWARSIRDQCIAAARPFFFKQWGEWRPEASGECGTNPRPQIITIQHDGQITNCAVDVSSGRCSFATAGMTRVGRKRAGRTLDGRTWDEMPESHAEALSPQEVST